VHSRDLIKTARELVAATNGKPRQSNLHRATSTAYYAIFHTLAKSCADLLVGTNGSQHSKPAWRQIYRSLAHTSARDACNNTKTMPKFPQEIQDFANMFVNMQAKRHDADYNPFHKTTKSEVITDINAVEVAIADFVSTDLKDRRAFCVWVLFKERRA
jgi:uncharacterized protein (UPF0332 family)